MSIPINIGLTLIENNSDTQLWAHPNDINLTNFIFGETYINVHIFQDADKEDNEINFEVFPGGVSFALPLGEFKELYKIDGILVDQDLATKNLIRKFFSRHRKIGQPKAYIIINHGTMGYLEFPDPSGNMIPYAPGWLTTLEVPFDAKKYQFLIKGGFQITWL